MKRLIINADEFGLTKGTNKAIVEAHQFGTVTSTTMIVNMWTFEDAVRLAKENPSLGVGIHLNITDGSPLLPLKEVSSLVDDEGRFYSRRHLMVRLTLGKINLDQVESEFRSQTNKLISKGITPTHIDDHQCIILHPKIFKIITKLASELKMPIRIPQDNYFLNGRWMRRKTAHWICKGYRRRLKKKEILTTDFFYKVVDFYHGKFWGEALLLRYYQSLLPLIKTGTSELMVHPSYKDGNLVRFMVGSETMARQREEELKVLLNPRLKEILSEEDFHLIHFRKLQ